jgi:hypothetical protein
MYRYGKRDEGREVRINHSVCERELWPAAGKSRASTGAIIPRAQPAQLAREAPVGPRITKILQERR